MADQQKEFFSDIKGEFKDLGAKVNKLFDEIVHGKARTDAYPVSVDVYETGEHIVFELDLPGFAKADVNVQVRDNKLIIRGRRTRSYEGAVTMLIRERAFGEFQREFSVPAGADANQTKAKFLENGVLRITLPKEAVEIESSEVNID